MTDPLAVVSAPNDRAAVTALLGMPMRVIGAHAAPEAEPDDMERVARLCADYLIPHLFVDVPVELQTGLQTDAAYLPSRYLATASPEVARWRVRLQPMESHLAVVRIVADQNDGAPDWVGYPPYWEGGGEEEFRTKVAKAVNAALRHVDAARLKDAAAKAAGQLPGTPGPKQW